MQEDDRLSFTTHARRVVVEARSIQVEKFAAHVSAAVVYAGGKPGRRQDT